MGYSNSLSKRSRIVAALSLLFFVVYCSVGVCTNLLNSIVKAPEGTSVAAAVDHSQHQMDSETVPEHCQPESSGCQWSVNPVFDPVADAQPATSFFFLYVTFASALLLSLLQRLQIGGSFFSFAREQFYQRSYPRIHIQKSVFQN